MSIETIIRQLEKEALQQREYEQRILYEIAEISSLDFAEQLADTLNPKKHLYSFKEYLSLLQMLVTVLLSGIPPDKVLDAVQTDWDIKKLSEIWKCWSCTK